MSHLLNASVVLNRPDGLHVVGMALTIACAAARSDIELACDTHEDNTGYWWDLTQTVFMGESKDEVECRKELQRSVFFLETYGSLQRHPNPALRHCVRFVGEPAKAIVDTESDRLKALINSPEVDSFLKGVHLEAVHQIERWGNSTDRGKRPADWFWLVGYLAGKALHAADADNQQKALHHCISTAAALYNWHCAIKGVDVRMCPARSDIAEIVEKNFPGEAATDLQEVAHGSR